MISLLNRFCFIIIFKNNAKIQLLEKRFLFFNFFIKKRQKISKTMFDFFKSLYLNRSINFIIIPKNYLCKNIKNA